MLVNVSISRWTARKYDRKVSEEVDATHGAHDGGRFNKLLIDKAHIKDLNTSAGNIRTYHYRMTLPWDDEGPRLLPAKLYITYIDAMRKLRTEDEQLRQVFLAKYPALVTQARARLGSMYDPDDYPSVDDLVSKFDFKLSFSPVPSAHDFRVNVGEQEAASIRESINAENTERFKSAIKDCYTRLNEVVTRIHETLSKEEPRIFDTMMDNAKLLVDCLPALNLSDDPKLEELRQDLEELLVPSNMLRQSKVIREEKADEAARILEKMRGWT